MHRLCHSILPHLQQFRVVKSGCLQVIKDGIPVLEGVLRVGLANGPGCRLGVDVERSTRDVQNMRMMSVWFCTEEDGGETEQGPTHRFAARGPPSHRS
jgi:hypothetical protein